MRKLNVIRFKLLVGKALHNSIDSKKIITDDTAIGASGQIIKFLYSVLSNDIKSFIEPIVTEDTLINWNNIYYSHGRLSDVKKLASLNKRLVILEQSNNLKKLNKASSFLANVASVRTFQSTENWSSALNVA